MSNSSVASPYRKKLLKSNTHGQRENLQQLFEAGQARLISRLLDELQLPQVFVHAMYLILVQAHPAKELLEHM